MVIKKESLFIFIILFSCYFVSASSLGITPAKIELDFEPKGKFLVNFQATGAKADQSLEVFAEGDFAEYVTFDKTTFKGMESFTVYIDLPPEAMRPGDNKLYIKIAEKSDSGGGFGVRLIVGGLIVFKVPYPGKYAEIKGIHVNPVNEYEPLNFEVEVENLGSDNLLIESKLNIYLDNKSFETYELGHKSVLTKETVSFFKSVEEGYQKGSYVAETIVSYDGGLRNFSRQFEVGTLFVEILNWTERVLVGKINEFDIGVKSKWNNKIEDVYAEVNVTKSNNQADFFKTPSIGLERQGEGVLKGFFNTENLSTGKYQAQIKLFYGEETNEKIVDIRVGNKNNINWVYVIGGIVIGILIIFIIVLFFKRKK
jgi:hypothetical protein